MMMREAKARRTFIDSNILFYALGDDAVKSPVGLTILNTSPCVSIQVINESTHVLTRKWKIPISRVKEMLEDVLTLTPRQKVPRKYHAEYSDLSLKCEVGLRDNVSLGK